MNPEYRRERNQRLLPTGALLSVTTLDWCSKMPIVSSQAPEMSKAKRMMIAIAATYRPASDSSQKDRGDYFG